MLKRVTASFLAMLMLLASATFLRMFVFAPEKTFKYYDDTRAISLENALKDIKNIQNNSGTSEISGERYIIKFRDGVDIKNIENILTDKNYYPLAETDKKYFAVGCDKDFTEQYKDIIEYSEPDNERIILSAPNDPLAAPSYGNIGIYDAWDISGDVSGITVAVLDTGVERLHEDLVGVNILAGYDAVKRAPGIYGDEVGHGTAVIGIIAAATNNKKGISGVASGVTVLPVKVSSSGATIYSSDLIIGIRFAADAGAKIINMSVGGYSPSHAEQEAVDYAVSKGCILIAASGNEGNRSYAGQKSYPASYNGVISVASSSADGVASDFSQYNDAVFVAAPGENIPVPVYENGRSAYKNDSGTSYSAAIVSGIAALAYSKAGNVRFGQSEFESLIREVCGNVKTDKLGYGMINARAAVSIADKPIVTGVIEGVTYSEKVTVGFNRGEAFLDGESIFDGETVLQKGKHTLTVKDGDYEKSYVFRLNYTPLSCKVKEYADHSAVEFNRGTALLDGNVYRSGEKISSFGEHIFVLSDGDEVITKKVFVSGVNSEIIGAEDGGVYDEPITVSACGGKCFIDGKEFFGTAVVYKNGEHEAEVRGNGGNVLKKIKFTVNIRDMRVTKSDYASPKVCFDKTSGYTFIYGDSLVGVRVYFTENYEKYDKFLRSGTIYSHAVCGDKIIFVGENGLYVIDPKTEEFTVYNDNESGFYLVTENGDNVIAFAEDGIYYFDPKDNEKNLFEPTDNIFKAAYSDGKILKAYSPESGSIFVYDLIGGEMNIFPLASAQNRDAEAIIRGDYAVIGNSVYSVNGEHIIDLITESTVDIKDDLVFTAEGIFDIKTAEIKGIFPFDVSDIIFGETKNIIFGAECDVLSVPVKEGISAYGAAIPNEKCFSGAETADIYRSSVFYEAGADILSVAAFEGKIYILFVGDNRLYTLDDDLKISSVPLRFVPGKIVAESGYLCVTSLGTGEVYVLGSGNSEGKYLKINGTENICIFDGKIFSADKASFAVYYTDINGENTVRTSLRAEKIDSDGERLYTLYEKTLSSHNRNLSVIRSIRVTETELRCMGGNVVLGKTVYGSDLNLKYLSSRSVLAVSGDAFVTSEGLCSFASNSVIGHLGISSPKTALFGTDNSLFVFGKGSIIKHSFGDGTPVYAVPEIKGADDGGVYIGGTEIYYEKGIGYVDGEKINSGDYVSDFGERVFVLALPCGRYIENHFRIAVKLEKIEFVVTERQMSVGETIILHVMYLPEGANAVPINYYCESDGINIEPSGKVTASRVGTYKITASVVGNADMAAECTVRVSDDLVAFKPESGFSVDRENGVVLPLPAGTDAEKLLSSLATGASSRVLDKDGNTRKGSLCTGDKIVIYSDGKVIDELYISVSGDVDGDGIVSAYDLYEIERILKGVSRPFAFNAAADMTGDGIVTNGDYAFLRNVLLGKIRYSLGETDDNPFGSFSVSLPTQTEKDGMIDAALCIVGCKHTKAVSGYIELGEGLTYVSSVNTGWEYNINYSDGKIYFTSYAPDGSESGTAFKVLFGIKLRVGGDIGDEIAVNCENIRVKLGDKTLNLRANDNILKVKEPLYGEFSIDILSTHRFVYEKNKHEYSITVPYNCALVDTLVTRGETDSVYLSDTVIPDGGKSVLRITRSLPGGKTEEYIINVRRDKEPVFDTNCYLASLQIEGYKLDPVFDPKIYVYSVAVPYGTEKISLFCEPQSGKSTVIISDLNIGGKSGSVTVTVISEDGDTAVYTVNVTVLPESAPDVKKEEGGGKTKKLIFVAVFTLLAGGLLMLRFRTKHDPDDGTDGTDGNVDNTENEETPESEDPGEKEDLS